MNIQAKLNEAYQPLFDLPLIGKRLSNVDESERLLQQLNGPFLLATNDQYEQSNPKVVIVGQENNGWFESTFNYHKYITTHTIEDAVEHYRAFNLERSYNSTFFQYFAKIRDGITGGSCETNHRSILWLNLFKLNHDGKPTVDSPYLEQMLAIQGDIFQREIEILRPDAVIFLTGPNYDFVLKRFYPDVIFSEVDGHPIREIASVQSKELPKLSFRTYHPGHFSYVQHTKAYCYDTIIERIRKTYVAI